MKKVTLLLTVFVLSIFIWSCGGDSNSKEDSGNKVMSAQEKAMRMAGASDEDIAEMNEQIKKMGENVKKIEEEAANETEEDKKIFSDKNIKLLGLNIIERKIADATWEKAFVLEKEYNLLSNEELRALNPDKIEGMFVNAGFVDIADAKSSLSKISKGRKFVNDVGFKMSILKSSRFMDGEEEYNKEMRELGEIINDRAYSTDDLRIFDENNKTSATITEILYRLNQ